MRRPAARILRRLIHLGPADFRTYEATTTPFRVQTVHAPDWDTILVGSHFCRSLGPPETRLLSVMREKCLHMLVKTHYLLTA